MPYYHSLNNAKPDDRRTAEGLLRLRAALTQEIPAKTTESTLLIASWNLREFGGNALGGREREPLFYIAEIISAFDIVAVQEVRDNLDTLDQLMNILGSWWDYLVTDVTPGAAGNRERLAFVFDKRKVVFGGLAGEISPPATKGDDGLLTSPQAFARSPYLAGFRAGWFKFSICTGHLYYGLSKADDPQRVIETEQLVAMLQKRLDAKDRWARNLILLGDFNVFSNDDAMFKKLYTVFKQPPGLSTVKTNQDRTKPFDQLAFLSTSQLNVIDESRSGVFDYYQQVYRLQDETAYDRGTSKLSFKQWRSYKMSDHLPIWCEVGIDFGIDYLQGKAKVPVPK
jgi:hypothetical protein